MDLYPKIAWPAKHLPMYVPVKHLPMYVSVCLQLETVGDCYIVLGGLMHTDGDGYTSVREDADPLHAVNVMRFAKVMHKNSGACI